MSTKPLDKKRFRPLKEPGYRMTSDAVTLKRSWAVK